MKKSFILVAVFLAVACASNEKKTDAAPAAEVKTETAVLATPVTSVAEEKPKSETPKAATPAKDSEWKGECRKVTNEGGQEVKNSPYKRLQSSYIFEGTKVAWIVKKFADTKCQSIFGGARSNFTCEESPLKKATTCKQVSIGAWKDNAWVNEKMVDSAGYPNELTMVYQVIPKKGNKVTLSSHSVTDDGETESETLTKP